MNQTHQTDETDEKDEIDEIDEKDSTDVFQGSPKFFPKLEHISLTKYPHLLC